VHIIRLLPKLTGHYNKKLIALTERAHCKDITPSKTITQLFFLPVLYYSTKTLKNLDVPLNFMTEEVGSNLLLLTNKQTNKQTLLQQKKLCQIKKCHQLSGQKDFANFITKWLLAYVTKE